ncbi:hypothetical protein Tco_1440087 [Tanacetum coccineum]
MHTTMVPEQVKTMKIQAGIQVSRPGELKRQLQLWKRFGRLYLIVFVLVRNIVRDAPPKKQVIDTQPAEETVATTDAIQSLRAFESAEDQVNQPQTADAKKIMDEYDQKNKAAQEVPESPYDTESEIKIIKRFQPCQPDDDDQIIFSGSEPVNIIIEPTKSTKIDNSDKTGSGLQFMLEDDLASLSGFETPKFDEAIADNILETSTDGADSTFNASTDMPAQSDLLGHLQEELRIIHTKVDQLESSISKKVIDDL